MLLMQLSVRRFGHCQLQARRQSLEEYSLQNAAARRIFHFPAKMGHGGKMINDEFAAALNQILKARSFPPADAICRRHLSTWETHPHPPPPTNPCPHLSLAWETWYSFSKCWKKSRKSWRNAVRRHSRKSCAVYFVGKMILPVTCIVEGKFNALNSLYFS